MFKKLKSTIAILKAIILERTTIKKLDNTLPLSGALNLDGFLTMHLLADQLKGFQKRIDQLCNGGKSTPILHEDFPLVHEILTKLEIPIKNYLGDNAEVTNAFWEKAITSDTAVSGAWHTDGCGHQIKIY